MRIDHGPGYRVYFTRRDETDHDLMQRRRTIAAELERIEPRRRVA